jgi:hypothetical protein
MSELSPTRLRELETIFVVLEKMRQEKPTYPRKPYARLLEIETRTNMAIQHWYKGEKHKFVGELMVAAAVTLHCIDQSPLMGPEKVNEVITKLKNDLANNLKEKDFTDELVHNTETALAQLKDTFTRLSINSFQRGLVHMWGERVLDWLCAAMFINYHTIKDGFYP